MNAVEPPAETTKRPATRAEARALAHPLRLRILRLCLDEPLTNRELADRLGEQPATVFYHVRTLARNGFLVRQAERRGRRGAREVPYRSTRKSMSISFDFDEAGHLAVVDATRAELVEAGSEALLTMSRLGVRLSPEQVGSLLERIHALVGDVRAQEDPSGDPVGLLVLLHRRPYAHLPRRPRRA